MLTAGDIKEALADIPDETLMLAGGRFIKTAKLSMKDYIQVFELTPIYNNKMSNMQGWIWNNLDDNWRTVRELYSKADRKAPIGIASGYNTARNMAASGHIECMTAGLYSYYRLPTFGMPDHV